MTRLEGPYTGAFVLVPMVSQRRSQRHRAVAKSIPTTFGPHDRAQENGGKFQLSRRNTDLAFGDHMLENVAWSSPKQTSLHDLDCAATKSNRQGLRCAQSFGRRCLLWPAYLLRNSSLSSKEISRHFSQSAGILPRGFPLTLILVGTPTRLRSPMFTARRSRQCGYRFQPNELRVMRHCRWHAIYLAYLVLMVRHCAVPRNRLWRKLMTTRGDTG
ncbi:hypothetical protein ABIF90_007321 [Bradyrhizobium japonicum]